MAFTWYLTSPGPGVGVDNFLVRWTGTLRVPKTGTYTLGTANSDGVRLWLNNNLILNRWYDQVTDLAKGSPQARGCHDRC